MGQMPYSAASVHQGVLPDDLEHYGQKTAYTCWSSYPMQPPEIPLKTRATLNNDEVLHMLYHVANEVDILQEAEKRQNSILDADYHKVEVDPFVQELKHLTMDEKQILSKTLKNFPTLFGVGLGMLDIKPVGQELIYGAKSYHARLFC
jgi:hypothetical protein